MGPLRRFGRFWYDFIVGDDWVAAVGVAVALGVTATLTPTHDPWWLLPVAVAAVLTVSVRRGVHAVTRLEPEPGAPPPADP